MDRFLLVPQKFTDRAGWDDVASINFPNLIGNCLAPRVDLHLDSEEERSCASERKIVFDNVEGLDEED